MNSATTHNNSKYAFNGRKNYQNTWYKNWYKWKKKEVNLQLYLETPLSVINKISRQKITKDTDLTNTNRSINVLCWVYNNIYKKHSTRQQRNDIPVHAHKALTNCDRMDCSLPGSSVPGIFQAIVLEWVAISFSNI